MKAVANAAGPDPAKVLTQATLKAAELLELSGSELAKIIGTSGSSVSRMGTGGKLIEPSSKEGELALLLVRLYRSLDALVGNDTQRRADWLGSHNRAFNARPRELIQSAEGLVKAVTYLDGMRATV